MRLKDARLYGLSKLSKTSQSSALDVRILLEHALNVSSNMIFPSPEYQLSEKEEIQFKILIAKREARAPIAYIIKSKEFYGLSFAVTPDVLIPRPDSETLVEAALSYIKQRFTYTDSIKIIDIGTGSGALIISILSNLAEFENIEAIGIDISKKALEIAEQNRINLLPEFSGLKFIQEDILSPNALAPKLPSNQMFCKNLFFDNAIPNNTLPHILKSSKSLSESLFLNAPSSSASSFISSPPGFPSRKAVTLPCFSKENILNISSKKAFNADVIISNPPYIRKSEIDMLSPDVKNFEPLLALNGGEDGLLFYHALAKNTHSAALICEIGKGQKEDVKKIFESEGYLLKNSFKDYSSITRALLFEHASFQI